MKIDFITDSHDDELVVFLLGMTVRKPWRLDQLGFATYAMARMQAELIKNRNADASIGYLGGYNAMALHGPTVVQYWRSFDDLEHYARADDRRHRPAWLKMYRLAHDAKSVGMGLWHETYSVPAGAHETIYGNMRPIGLAKAVGAQPMERRGRTSRERLNAHAAAT